jgi:hypothetical protein
MSDLSDELDLNAEAFRDKWKLDLVTNLADLGQSDKFIRSYRRISALQALRTSIIAPLYGADVGAFFVEAQNDALTSHVFASFGAWRSSLNALRSCIEDAFGALYFKDHPVELRLWNKGKFRLGFSSAYKYFSDHPNLDGLQDGLTGLEAIKDEYATLSKAVHGSAKNFRMTDDAAGLLLWSTQAAKLGAWETRHRKVLEATCLLVVSLHAEKLQGVAHANLRAVLGHAIGANRRTQLRETLHIHIEAP